MDEQSYTQKENSMFARFKTTAGKSANVTPWAVSAFWENTDGTTSIVGQGFSLTVQDSAQRVRNQLSKGQQAPAPEADDAATGAED